MNEYNEYDETRISSIMSDGTYMPSEWEPEPAAEEPSWFAELNDRDIEEERSAQSHHGLLPEQVYAELKPGFGSAVAAYAADYAVAYGIVARRLARRSEERKPTEAEIARVLESM